MRVSTATAYASVGAALIALGFGLARYAFGLFVPAIRAELGLSPDQIGLVSSLAFISFSLAIVIAPAVADRLGARSAAMLAAGFGLAGLGAISGAGNALALGAGVFACGICTGLMMPALSAGARVAVDPGLQGRVNAIMNAGTSLGLVFCVPAVLLLDSAWRSAYAAFALLAAAAVLAAWRSVPAASRIAETDPVPPITGYQIRSLLRLAGFGLATGVASSCYWIFAPDLAVEIGGLDSRMTGALWLTVGIAGLAGAWASDLSDRIGADATQALALTAVAGALALLAARPDDLVLALVSAAVFGWAFMTLSGLYLVTGVRLVPERPALGPVIPFLAVTVGQALGSPLFGWAIGRFGHVEAFTGSAVLALAIAACSPLYQARSRGRRRLAAARAARVSG